MDDSEIFWGAVVAAVVAATAVLITIAAIRSRKLIYPAQRALLVAACSLILIGSVALMLTWSNSTYALREIVSMSVCGHCTHTTPAYVAAVALWTGLPLLLTAFAYPYTVVPVVQWITGHK